MTAVAVEIANCVLGGISRIPATKSSTGVPLAPLLKPIEFSVGFFIRMTALADDNFRISMTTANNFLENPTTANHHSLFRKHATHAA